MVDFNIDQAMNDISTGAFEASPQVGEAVGTAPQINQPSFDPNLVIPYKANGKELQEPLSTVIQRASMGYNYAQLMQQHKQREAAIEAEKQQIAQQAQKWQQYDEFATQNPEWAEYVRSQWESRFNFGGQQQAQQPFGASQNQGSFEQQSSQMQLPPEVARELSEMRSFVSQYKQDQQVRMQAEQDHALNQEIETVAKEYPDIDLTGTDPMTGESLEQQILRHAQSNGISTFRAAFRDMMFDKLLARGQTQAKETVAKQMQQQIKSGFLGQSSSPMLSQQTSGVDLGRHSYHSLMDMAAKELGLN
jgi:hypothetical protein